MDTLYLAAISAVVPGLGRSRVPELLELMGGSQQAYEATAVDLKATRLFTEEQIAAFLAKRTVQLPRQLDMFCRRQGVRLVSIYDEEYPDSLREIHDAPLVLYVAGEIPECDYPVAIVGSREATPYGEKVAATFATAFAEQGLSVISGGARGIDSFAHTACIEAGGKTVAVLGSGIDVVYPRRNVDLFKRIVNKGGAIVTEFPPGTQPRGANFPMRNRIIVGLSQGVVVAEAKLRSGALITGNIAADEGRDVFCVPGNIFDMTSIGCHELIRNGAKLVDGPQDVLNDIAVWRSLMCKAVQPSIFDTPLVGTEPERPRPVRKEVKKRAAKTVNVKLDNLSELGKKLITLLSREALGVEALTEGCGEDFATVSMELLNLQMSGLIAVDAAQHYYRL